MSRKAVIKSLFFFLFSFSVGCQGLDVQQVNYATYEQAVNDGAITRGVLPAFLPPSATDIISYYDLDTGELWAAYQLNANDVRTMIQGHEEIDSYSVKFPRRKPTGKISWWPKKLRAASPESSHHYKFYRCYHETRFSDSTVKKPAFMAVATESSTTWYWIPE